MDNVQADLLLEIAQGSEHFSKCLIFHVQHFEIHALLYFNNIMYVYLCVCTHVCVCLCLSDQGCLLPFPNHAEMASETTLTLIYWDQNPHDSN